MSRGTSHFLRGGAGLLAAALVGLAQAGPVVWKFGVVDAVDRADALSTPAMYANSVAYTRRSDGGSGFPGIDLGGVYVRGAGGERFRVVAPGDPVPGGGGQTWFSQNSFNDLNAARPSIHAGQLAVRLSELAAAPGCSNCPQAGYYGYSYLAPSTSVLTRILDSQAALPGGGAGPGGTPSLQAGPIGRFVAFENGDALYDAAANGNGPVRLVGNGTRTTSVYVYPVTGRPLDVTLTDGFGAFPVVDVNEPAGFPGDVQLVFYARGDLAKPSGGTFRTEGVYVGRYDASFAALAEVRPVADNTTELPGHPGETFVFGGFGGLSPDIDNGWVALYGEGDAGTRGIFAGSVGGPLSMLADTSTPIPDGTGLFTSFGYSSVNNGRVAFVGGGENGQIGLYLADSDGVHKVFDSEDFEAMFPGETLIDSFYTQGGIGFFHDGLQGGTLAFSTESFTLDPTGSLLEHHSRVLMAFVPEPESALLVLLALLALAGARHEARRPRPQGGARFTTA